MTLYRLKSDHSFFAVAALENLAGAMHLGVGCMFVFCTSCHLAESIGCEIKLCLYASKFGVPALLLNFLMLYLFVSNEIAATAKGRLLVRWILVSLTAILYLFQFPSLANLIPHNSCCFILVSWSVGWCAPIHF